MPTDIPLSFMDPGHRRVRIMDNGFSYVDATQSFQQTVEIAQSLEAAGFHRLWYGEHHAEKSFHSVPAMLVAAIAARTNSIRVGTAGVTLPYQKPFMVAEMFRALSAWYPGRIDMGLVKGPGALEEVRQIILKENGLDPDVFRQDVAEVVKYMAAETDVHIAPTEKPSVQTFCMSGDPKTLTMAAKNGMGVGLPLFLSTRQPDVNLRAAGKRFAAYYTPYFEPSESIKEPTIVCADSLICLDDADALQALAKFRGGPWQASFIGRPAACVDVIHSLLDMTGATEFAMFQSPCIPGVVKKSAALLAAELGHRDVTHTVAGETA